MSGCWYLKQQPGGLGLRSMLSVLSGWQVHTVCCKLHCCMFFTACCCCREVGERLRRPAWMPEQHCLWPAAFKAAVAELLCCLHLIDWRLAGNAGDWAGRLGGAFLRYAVEALSACRRTLLRERGEQKGVITLEHPPSRTAGMAVEGDGQPGQQAAAAAAALHTAFPDRMRMRIVEHLGTAWEWPAAAQA